jgi:molybdate transport system substrate-binding protein
MASVLLALALTLFSTVANADEIHILSGGGPQAALRAFIPEFESATGHRVYPTFAHVSVIQQKLAAGEKTDLILLPVPLIAAAEKALHLRPEGRVVLARVGIAVIVRKGTAPPNISTPDAVRKMLLDLDPSKFLLRMAPPAVTSLACLSNLALQRQCVQSWLLKPRLMAERS